MYILYLEVPGGIYIISGGTRRYIYYIWRYQEVYILYLEVPGVNEWLTR